MNSVKPLLALTLGDPSGIGPEVVVKALADPEDQRFGAYVRRRHRAISAPSGG